MSGTNSILLRKIVPLYVLAGFVLPWLTIFIVNIWYGRFEELTRFPEHLFASGYNYFLTACLDSIPFVVAALAAFCDLSLKRSSVARRFGIWFGAFVVLALSVAYQGAAWLNLLGPHPDALTGIAFLYLPLPVTAAFVVSASLVWAGASLWLRTRP
jgi:hypothetical protein